MDAPLILVLDDLPDMLELLESVLTERGGYRVAPRLERTVAVVAEVAPALVITDAPRGNNVEALNFVQRLRLSDATAHLPVILTTTSLRSTAPSSVLRERGVHVILKPFSIGELLESITTLLGRRAP